MKLERKALLHYIDASFGGETPKWFLIGRGMDELTVNLNPDTESKEDILGETSTEDNGYAPQMDADPYYANTTDAIYPKIQDIAMNRLKGDACRTKILEVIIEDTAASSHRAWMEDVIVKPQSYGGDTKGVNIPYSVSFDGNRVEGTAAITGKVPTFTAGAAVAQEG